MTDLYMKSTTELAELIRTGNVSPVEVLQAHFDRIDQLNPKLNAIVTLAADAMTKAKEAEATVTSGGVLGPLHGVPVTVKDTIETAGLRTTSGSLLRSEFVPERDAPAVARLKAAGAIILGKTNAAEMAMDYNADNPVFGRTNNPYNPSLTPGGSSGGEAAAIASCLSPGGIGSDLAGSIRIPAHFCGIAGLKPTVGRVPGGGQFPPSTGPYSLGAVIGPMARSVSDLGLLFDVLAGNELSASRLPEESLHGSRVAYYTDDTVAAVSEETRKAVETAARILSEAGMIAVETLPPGIDRGHDLWLKLFSRASVVQLRNVYTGHEDKGGDFVRWRLATADDSPQPSLDDYIQSWLERDRLRATLLEWMEDTPLIVAPVGATPAYEHDTHKLTVGKQTMSTFRAFSYSQAFNVFDLPVVVVTAGVTADGLPIGVQIAGRPFAEETVLQAAAIIEEALGGWQPPLNSLECADQSAL
ncbi:MAG TPA: amidase [Pyrinomonadaceae bacterium]|jgi:Asp-tRNA(Asn)/Glu-tRNA(Gln) amidotransferase A subunit family amidase|nr:amidase [Pyrinomonadaceae bacterium]